MRRLLRAAWDLLMGALACASLPGSVIAVGWTQRLMQRTVLREWHAASGCAEPFAAFAEAGPDSALHATLPGWFRSDGNGPRTWLAGLFRNARLGLAATLNTWALTLPACVLWLFAWYDGWNNSFYKGYEQAAVGPLTGVAGVALFIAAMLYVPLAQARQAATGEWRCFWQFRLVLGLVRLRWARCTRLAALYALVSIPVTALKTAPMAFDRLPAYASWSDAAALELLQQYFFFAGAFVFVAYVWLRLSAARIYGDAVVDAVRSGALAPDQLGAFERAALARLDLLGADPPATRHAVVRALGGAGRLAFRAGAVSLAAAFWFAFVAQIFVSEFLNYHPAVGWLNQPLVQLPWFRYIPSALGL